MKKPIVSIIKFVPIGGVSDTIGGVSDTIGGVSDTIRGIIINDFRWLQALK